MAQKKFEIKAVYTIDADNEQTMEEFEKLKNLNMKKYRIVKISEAAMSVNIHEEIDFIPEVGVEVYYQIEIKETWFLWGFFSKWVRWHKEFDTLEKVERYIEYLKLKESVNQEQIIKEL